MQLTNCTNVALTFSHSLTPFLFLSFSFYRTIAFKPVRQPTAAKEEKEITDGVHQPSDLRAGEAVPVPEVPVTFGSGRDSGRPRPLQRTGKFVIRVQATRQQSLFPQRPQLFPHSVRPTLQQFSLTARVRFLLPRFTGHHLVPEPTGQAEARHGGAEEGRRDGEGAVRTQNVPGECERYEHSQEENHARRRWQPTEVSFFTLTR